VVAHSAAGAFARGGGALKESEGMSGGGSGDVEQGWFSKRGVSSFFGRGMLDRDVHGRTKERGKQPNTRFCMTGLGFSGLGTI